MLKCFSGSEVSVPVSRFVPFTTYMFKFVVMSVLEYGYLDLALGRDYLSILISPLTLTLDLLAVSIMSNSDYEKPNK